MNRRSERNNELMKYLKCKLVKENDKVTKVQDWIYDKDEMGGEKGEALTLGTEENQELLIKSSIVPGAVLTVGLGAMLLGLVVFVPLLEGPGATEAERQFLAQVGNTGNKIISFSYDTFKAFAGTLVIPAGVAAISIPKRVIRYIADKVERHGNATVLNNTEIIEMLQDVLNDKQDDDTLELPKKFLKRVDLNGNDEKFNLELFGHLAYYRYCLKGVKTGEKTEDDVLDAYENLTLFLQSAKHKFGVNKNFKNNRFVELLTEDYGYKQGDFVSSKTR